MEIVRKASLYLKASKCKFNKSLMTFLGYVIAADGIKTDPAKVKALSEFPTPKDLKQTTSFLEMVGYYRRFIPGFLAIVGPLSSFTKKDRVFKWTGKQEGTFQLLKAKLSEAPVLCHYSPEAETILQTAPLSLAGDSLFCRLTPKTAWNTRLRLSLGDLQVPSSIT